MTSSERSSHAHILKPYILDLVPGNSFVEYLVEQGHDVYLLDWGSPGITPTSRRRRSGAVSKMKPALGPTPPGHRYDPRSTARVQQLYPPGRMSIQHHNM